MNLDSVVYFNLFSSSSSCFFAHAICNIIDNIISNFQNSNEYILLLFSILQTCHFIYFLDCYHCYGKKIIIIIQQSSLSSIIIIVNTMIRIKIMLRVQIQKITNIYLYYVDIRTIQTFHVFLIFFSLHFKLKLLSGLPIYFLALSA